MPKYQSWIICCTLQKKILIGVPTSKSEMGELGIEGLSKYTGYDRRTLTVGEGPMYVVCLVTRFTGLDLTRQENMLSICMYWIQTNVLNSNRCTVIPSPPLGTASVLWSDPSMSLFTFFHRRRMDAVSIFVNVRLSTEKVIPSFWRLLNWDVF